MELKRLNIFLIFMNSNGKIKYLKNPYSKFVNKLLYL